MNLRTLFVFLAALIALPAAAGPYSDALGACLADNTTGKERKDLARWMFLAIAAHPEIRTLSNVSDEVRDKTFQSVGEVLTRLLSESCVAQVRAAVQHEGSQSLNGAFNALGQLAFQELMSAREVSAAISGVERYTDREKIQAALSSK